MSDIKFSEEHTLLGDLKVGDKTFEVKVSFLSNITPSWSLTHIRPWHKIDYYLICFIDCSNNFNPMFFVIPKVRINQLKMTAMNGTQKTNADNHNIELRTTIKNSSNDLNNLRRWNLLESTDEKSLKKFIENME